MANLYPTLADFQQLGTVIEELREQLDDLEDKNCALEARCAELEAKNAQLERQLVDDVATSLAEFRGAVSDELQKRAVRINWDLIDPVELANGVSADTTMDVSPFAAPGSWVRLLVFTRAVNNETGRVAKVETVSGEGVVVSRGFVKIHGGPQTDVGTRGGGAVPNICEVQSTFDLFIPLDGPASIRLALTYGEGANVSFTCLCTAVGVEAS